MTDRPVSTCAWLFPLWFVASCAVEEQNPDLNVMDGSSGAGADPASGGSGDAEGGASIGTGGMATGGIGAAASTGAGTGGGTTGGAGGTGGAPIGTGGDPLAATGGSPGGCAVGEEDCGGGCVVLRTNNAHCGSCGTACAAGEQCIEGVCCATLVAPIARADSYVLEFGDTYFAVQAAGGKIIEFRRGSGSNLLTLRGSPGEASYINFGSTLWTSPQSGWNSDSQDNWPPPEATDRGAYNAMVDELQGTITMQSLTLASVGPAVVVTKTFTADRCGGAVHIRYTIRNDGDVAVSLAPWEVTRVHPSGLSFFPAGSVRVLGDTPLQLNELSGVFWFDHATSSVDNGKVSADGAEGWIAHTDGQDLFVKAWSDVLEQDQVDGHGEVEIYDGSGSGYIELEVQGAGSSLAAGGETALDVRWFVRPMPTDAARTAGDAALVESVRQLLADTQ
jgi:hypothetical protein